MKQTKGRQTRDGAAVRRVQVMLDEATIERAKALGDGNASQGIRRAVKEAAGRLRHVRLTDVLCLCGRTACGRCNTRAF